MRNGPQVITNGLVLALDAADKLSYPGSGNTWRDISGNGRNGTLTNGPLYSESSQGVIRFDGTNDVVTISNNFIPADSPLSVCVWARITTGLFIIDTLNDSTAWDGFGITANGGGGNKFIWHLLKQYSGPTISAQITSNGGWAAGVWINVTCTYNGSTSAIYLNGSLDNSTSYSSGYDVGQPNIGIGARQSSGAASNCDIGSVFFYNRALTSIEIQQNFNAMRGRFGI